TFSGARHARDNDLWTAGQSGWGKRVKQCWREVVTGKGQQALQFGLDRRQVAVHDVVGALIMLEGLGGLAHIQPGLAQRGPLLGLLLRGQIGLFKCSWNYLKHRAVRRKGVQCAMASSSTASRGLRARAR